MEKEVEVIRIKSNEGNTEGNEDSIKENVYLEELKIDDLEKILEFQEEIIKDIEDKDTYAKTSREEFINYFKTGDVIMGYFTEDDEIAGMGVLANYRISEDNYGYDLGFRGEELLDIVQIDSVAVGVKFRGNNLQKKICKSLESIAISRGFKILCTTIAPTNEVSVNVFKSLGYNILREKVKYGGLRRYVLIKYI